MSVPANARSTKHRKSMHNTTIRQNSTILPQSSAVSLQKEIDQHEKEKAYNKYLKAVLAGVLVDEAIERETSEIDLKMASLTKKFQMEKDILDKTNKRLKEISFLSERQRLLDLRNDDMSVFLDELKTDDPTVDLSALIQKQKSYLNRLQLNNVTIGSAKELHDTLKDTVSAFEDIKKKSKLTAEEFEEYHRMGQSLCEGAGTSRDVEDLRKKVESMMPKVCGDVLENTSDTLHRTRALDDEQESENTYHSL